MIRHLGLATLLLLQGRLDAQRALLEPPSDLDLKYVKAESTTFKGKKAVRLTDAGGENLPDGSQLAVLKGTNFTDGTIEMWVAGDVKPGMGEAFRGFTGLAFRVQGNGASYDAFYVRPLNARSENQVQRNHSVQYISHSEFPWRRLRTEEPKKYETYADMAPGEWIKMKIEVKGTKARLFLNDAQQPTLIVNDLKRGATSGALALWIGPGTVAHFAELRVSP